MYIHDQKPLYLFTHLTALETGFSKIGPGVAEAWEGVCRLYPERFYRDIVCHVFLASTPVFLFYVLLFVGKRAIDTF